MRTVGGEVVKDETGPLLYVRVEPVVAHGVGYTPNPALLHHLDCVLA